MYFVCLLNLLGQSMPITTVQDAYIVGDMLGEYHSLCTLKTSIVDFGKEKEHCSRYKSQNVYVCILYSPVLQNLNSGAVYYIL
jgi:hypothetical protein